MTTAGACMVLAQRWQRAGLAMLAGIGALALAGGALAQTALPAGTQIGLPTHDQLENPAPVPPTRAVAPSRLHVEDSIEHAPCALDRPDYAALKIRLTAATFEHLAPVAASALDDTWRGYLGSEQPISVLCRIRDAAATRLRALGYLAAVEVPVQRISDGQVRFEVLFARIVAVRVLGHPGNDRAVLQGYLQKLADGAVFNRFVAERQILLARDLPGYDLTLTLKPAGSGAGAMIAEVRVENTPLTVDATVYDLAAPATGRFGGQLRATINGLMGLGDQTTLSAYSTAQFHKQQIWQAAHSMMLGSSGVQVSAHLTYAITRPELGGGLPPVDARTWLFDLAASYALVRHETGDLKLTGGIDVVDQGVLFGGQPLSHDRLRVGFVRLDADLHDPRGSQAWGLPRWRATAALELRQGLDIFGATPDCLVPSSPCLATGYVPPSVAVGDPQASVVRASAEVEVNPAPVISLDLAARGQWASAPLYAFEQFSLGNYSIGRGYVPGAVVGDDGLALSTDLRGPLLTLSRDRAIGAQPFVFADNGWAWRRLVANPQPHAVHSIGGGAHFVFGTQMQLDLTLAKPLTRVAGEAKVEPALLLVTLNSRLWPWRYR